MAVPETQRLLLAVGLGATDLPGGWECPWECSGPPQSLSSSRKEFGQETESREHQGATRTGKARTLRPWGVGRGLPRSGWRPVSLAPGLSACSPGDPPPLVCPFSSPFFSSFCVSPSSWGLPQPRSRFQLFASEGGRRLWVPLSSLRGWRRGDSLSLLLLTSTFLPTLSGAARNRGHPKNVV